MIVLAGTTALSSFWLEDGRMGLEARQYWQKTGIPNPGVLDYSIEQAQARGGWTAVREHTGEMSMNAHARSAWRRADVARPIRAANRKAIRMTWNAIIGGRSGLCPL